MQDIPQPRKPGQHAQTHPANAAAIIVATGRASPLLRTMHTQRDPAETEAALREVHHGIVQAENNLHHILEGLTHVAAPGVTVHASPRLSFSRRPALSQPASSP